jgi:hypothetical protein
MPLIDRVLSEGRKRGRIAQAFVDAFDAPVKFGGTPNPSKAKEKPTQPVKPVVRTPLSVRAGSVVKKVTTALFPPSDKPKKTESTSFYGRVLGEGKGEPWHKTLKRGAKFVGSQLGGIADAATGEGPRPRFKDNPWANIVHRSVEYQAGKGGSESSGKPEKPQRGASKLTGTAKPSSGSAAKKAFQTLQRDRQQDVFDKRERQSATDRRAKVGQTRTQLGGPPRPGQSPRLGRPQKTEQPNQPRR